MRWPRKRFWRIVGAVVACVLIMIVIKSFRNRARSTGVPLTWDDEMLANLAVPLAQSDWSPTPMAARSYYWTPIRTIYKTYPVYHPDREPPGYIEKLKQLEPVDAWSELPLVSPADWIAAGRVVFETPIFGGALGPVSEEYRNSLYVRERQWLEHVQPPVAADGTIPFYRYVVDAQGQVRVGVLSCAMCHTRVLDDGSIVHGAQGNVPFDRGFAFDYRFGGGPLDQQIGLERLLYHVPWANTDDAKSRLASTDAIAARHEAIPPGVMARHGSTPEHPVVVPDLFDLKDRAYFDRTGLQRNRGVGDIMRYAALNQGGDDFSAYKDFYPVKALAGFVPPAILNLQGRYSDDQLYALAMFINALKPPANPHPFDELAQRGAQVFEDQGCARCHAPPHYTTNKLTPVEGFDVPDDHRELYSIEDESVGTDPSLALQTRRGTGYYKIPSLRHVWLRGPFGHDGSCATLEDWFDPNRLAPEYVPTGFVGFSQPSRAVPGHEYGLDLDETDRKALIAFLKTL
jgi:hypothetical protein